MPISIRVPMFLCTALLLTVVGCQKVETTAAKTLNPGDVLAPIIVDGPNREQTVTVVASATGGPVDVYICSEDDSKVALEKLQPPKTPYGKSMGVEKETTFQGTAPAKKAYAVVVTGAKKPNTNVTLKMTAK